MKKVKFLIVKQLERLFIVAVLFSSVIEIQNIFINSLLMRITCIYNFNFETL